MRREVVDCDRCDAKEIHPVSFHLVVGRSPSPAGGRSEDDTKQFEFCERCAAFACSLMAKTLLELSDYTKIQALADKIGERIKRK